MIGKVVSFLATAYVLGAALWVVSAGVVRQPKATDQVELLNVACDPTRELWRDLNARFIDQYQRESGVTVSIRQSHGGSGSQARAVIDGLDADVVTLALWTDTDAIRKVGLIDNAWEERLPARSLPYTSTIVFVVRRGNPKNIRDWDDLARNDVEAITPNPKTSGNGKWSFLAMWGAKKRAGATDEQAFAFVSHVFRRVPVLDTGARAATMTFAQNGRGDVHLTWENEAHLEVQESNGALEIVYPTLSIEAEPHVALVDRVVDRKGTRVHAQRYLDFLYEDAAQEVIAQHYYRPTSAAIKQKAAARFPAITLFPARELGSWDAIQKRFFADKGLFDEIFARGSQP